MCIVYHTTYEGEAVTDIPVPENEPDTKPCKVCAEPIKRAARVCTHCNNYQDWYANIGMSSTILSLLVALVSVLTTAMPIVYSTLTPKNSDLSFSFQGVNEDIIGILVTNRGTRPGSVSYPMSLYADTFPLLNLKVLGESSSAVFLVEPGKSLLLQLTASWGFTWDKSDSPGEDCEIEIHKSDFTAKREAQWVIVPCKDMYYFLDKFNEKTKKDREGPKNAD